MKKLSEDKPVIGQLVIAIGYWHGEISGVGGLTFGLGTYMGKGSVDIDSDTYSTSLEDIIYWQPAPEWPEECLLIKDN